LRKIILIGPWIMNTETLEKSIAVLPHFSVDSLEGALLRTEHTRTVYDGIKERVNAPGALIGDNDGLRGRR
jgi:hypothetical protein